MTPHSIDPLRTSDPFEILGVGLDADDAAVRTAYLERIRMFGPERDPARFAVVRGAYDRIKDREIRMVYRVFGDGRTDSFEAMAREWSQRRLAARIPLTRLLSHPAKPR